MRYLSGIPKISHYCGCGNCTNHETQLTGSVKQGLGEWPLGTVESVAAALRHKRDNFGPVVCSNFNQTLAQLRNSNSWPPPLVDICEFSAVIP